MKCSQGDDEEDHFEESDEDVGGSEGQAENPQYCGESSLSNGEPKGVERRSNPIIATHRLALNLNHREHIRTKTSKPGPTDFRRNEVEAFSEFLRPPLSIACPTMAMANL